LTAASYDGAQVPNDNRPAARAVGRPKLAPRAGCSVSPVQLRDMVMRMCSREIACHDFTPTIPELSPSCGRSGPPSDRKSSTLCLRSRGQTAIRQTVSWRDRWPARRHRQGNSSWGADPLADQIAGRKATIVTEPCRHRLAMQCWPAATACQRGHHAPCGKLASR
jgi:hypothetical protein